MANEIAYLDKLYKEINHSYSQEVIEREQWLKDKMNGTVNPFNISKYQRAYDELNEVYDNLQEPITELESSLERYGSSMAQHFCQLNNLMMFIREELKKSNVTQTTYDMEFLGL